MIVEEAGADLLRAQGVGVACFGQRRIAGGDLRFDLVQLTCGRFDVRGGRRRGSSWRRLELALLQLDLVAQFVLPGEYRTFAGAFGTRQRLPYRIQGQTRTRMLTGREGRKVGTGLHQDIDVVLVVAGHVCEKRRSESFGREMVPPGLDDLDHFCHVLRCFGESLQRLESAGAPGE